jgi:hypothetical protein
MKNSSPGGKGHSINFNINAIIPFLSLPYFSRSTSFLWGPVYRKTNRPALQRQVNDIRIQPGVLFFLQQIKI